MKIIVTGANGQLGQEVKELAASYPGCEFHLFSRADLNIADAAMVSDVFEEIRPTHCINCAAYTAVDKAETETELAHQINAEGAKNLAIASRRTGAKLIHISTDYVFNGECSHPYAEDDETGPIGVYGASKLAGEQLCRQEDSNVIIIRTSWVFSSFGNNFVKTMLRLMPVKDSLNVVSDQLGCPTYAADLADAIMKIIISGKWKPGIYHYSNSDNTSWFDFAKDIKDHCQFKTVVNPIPTVQYPTPAARPQYSVMNTNKIRNTYSIEIRSWKAALTD